MVKFSMHVEPASVKTQSSFLVVFVLLFSYVFVDALSKFRDRASL